MSKKIFWLVAVVLIFTLVFSFSLAGCKEEADVEETEEEADVEETEEEFVLGTENATYWIEKAGIVPSGELTIYSYKDESCTENKVAQKYAEAYPDVTINWIAVPGGDYVTKILLEFQTGTEGFDVFWCYSAWAAQFNTFLQDITNRIPEELRNDIAPGTIAATSYKGAWFGIPLFLGNDNAVVYNKDILNQAGYDKPPETWDEFFKCAEDSVVDEDNDGIPEIYGYAGLCGGGGWAYATLLPAILKSVGGQFWNYDGENPKAMFNDDKGVRALQIMKRIFRSDFSDPVMASGDDIQARKSVAAGKTAMGILGAGAVFSLAKNDFPENVDNLGWSLMPYDPGYSSIGIDGSMGYVLRKGGNLEAALGFMLFYASPEMQKFVTEDYGYAAARQSLINDTEYVSKFPYVPVAIEQENECERYTEENAQVLNDGFIAVFDDYFNGKIDEGEALNQLEDVFITAWEDM